MKLTNYLRDSVILSVSNDIPEVKWPNLEQLQERLVKAFDKRVKAVYVDETLRKGLEQQYYRRGLHRGYVKVANLSIDDVLTKEVEQQTQREDVLSKLKGAVYGCSTLKQLQELLPDLVKHMPSEDAPTKAGLPVVAGLMDDLKKLGFKN